MEIQNVIENIRNSIEQSDFSESDKNLVLQAVHRLDPKNKHLYPSVPIDLDEYFSKCEQCLTKLNENGICEFCLENPI